MNTDSNEIVHWSLCRVAQHTNPRPEMLSGKVILPIRCFLRKESPRNSSPVLRYVSFDRSFVRHKLWLAVKDLDCKNLSDRDKSILRCLLGEVMNDELTEIEPDYGDIFDDQL